MISGLPRSGRTQDDEASILIMTQTFTGHRCFQSYLQSRKRALYPSCIPCGDTVKHTIPYFIVHIGPRRGRKWWRAKKDIRTGDILAIIIGPSRDLLLENSRRRRAILGIAEAQRKEVTIIMKHIMEAKKVTERESQSSYNIS